MNKIPVFLCYRQDDGAKMAKWLYERLNDQPIAPKDADSPRLDVYFDQTTPAISNWTKLHKPALQRAKAMLVVCTPLLAELRKPPDWVHKELEWWVKKRKTAPIPIERSRHDKPYLPDYVRGRWPDCQRLPLDLEEWQTLKGKDQSDTAETFIARIREGIRLSQTGIAFEDLRRFKRLSWGLAASLLFALIFLGGAGYQWNRAISARDAERQRAAQLVIVTDFQGSMLNKIDPEEMGRALFADLRSLVRESLEAQDVSPEDIESALDTFNQTLLRANATDAARTLIDEQVLSRAVKAIEQDFADQPLVRAALQQTVASTYQSIGFYDAALPLLKSALQTRRGELGEEHHDTLQSMYNLAFLYADLGCYQDAEALCVKTLEVAKRIHEEEHPGALASMGNLAFVYKNQGRYDDAESLYVKTLQITKRILGEEHPQTLGSMSDLAVLYAEHGHYDAAEPMFAKALAILDRVLGEEHPDTLNSMNNLTKLYRLQGRYEEAVPLQLKTLEIQKRSLGDEHRDTLGATDNLAALYSNLRRYDEAELLFVKTLQTRERVLPMDHPDTLRSMSNLALVYKSQDRYGEAEPLYIKALEIATRVMGDEHADTLGFMNNLASLYTDLGRYDEAEPLYIKTLEIRKRVRHEEHPDTLGSITNLGNLYLSMKRFDEARAMFESSLPIKRRVLGMGHAWTRYALKGLAQAYDGLNRGGDALPLWRELQEFRLAQVENPDTSAKALNTAAWDLLTNEHAELRDPARALPLAQRAVDEVAGLDPVILDTLAFAQHLTGDTPAAIETQKKALSLLPPDAPGRVDYEAALARFEAALREVDSAEEPGGG